MLKGQKQLFSYDFVKIHKKYIVNLKYIKRIHIAEEKILLDNGVELEISRRNKTNVLKKYKDQGVIFGQKKEDLRLKVTP